MKKADILSAIADKYAAVLAVGGPEQTANVGWYVANVLDVAGDTASQSNIGFYVVNEGAPGETAHWNKREPKPDVVPAVSVAAQVQALIAAKIADKTIAGAMIENVDEINVTAIVVAQVVQNGNVIERRMFLDKLSGELRTRNIV